MVGAIQTGCHPNSKAHLSSALHAACEEYEGYINGTATASTSMSTSIIVTSSIETLPPTPTAVSANSGGRQAPVGPIVGGGECGGYMRLSPIMGSHVDQSRTVVGGVVGLAVVIGVVYIIALAIKRNTRESVSFHD